MCTCARACKCGQNVCKFKSVNASTRTWSSHRSVNRWWQLVRSTYAHLHILGCDLIALYGTRVCMCVCLVINAFVNVHVYINGYVYACVGRYGYVWVCIDACMHIGLSYVFMSNVWPIYRVHSMSRQCCSSRRPRLTSSKRSGNVWRKHTMKARRMIVPRVRMERSATGTCRQWPIWVMFSTEARARATLTSNTPSISMATFPSGMYRGWRIWTACLHMPKNLMAIFPDGLCLGWRRLKPCLTRPRPSIATSTRGMCRGQRIWWTCFVAPSPSRGPCVALGPLRTRIKGQCSCTHRGKFHQTKANVQVRRTFCVCECSHACLHVWVKDVIFLTRSLIA